MRLLGCWRLRWVDRLLRRGRLRRTRRLLSRGRLRWTRGLLRRGRLRRMRGLLRCWRLLGSRFLLRLARLRLLRVLLREDHGAVLRRGDVRLPQRKSGENRTGKQKLLCLGHIRPFLNSRRESRISVAKSNRRTGTIAGRHRRVFIVTK
jgi:hypothetical protein